MKSLIHLNYPLDVVRLLKSAQCAESAAVPYTDSRYHDLSIHRWKISRYTDEYIQKIIDDFGVTGKPRFYFQEPHFEIPEHVDNGTQCSINFILSRNPAPITINQVEYYYKQCLLNTTVPHSVKNGPERRILFKISIFDKTFDETAAMIRFKSQDCNK